jgi:hypothetical protein
MLADSWFFLSFPRCVDSAIAGLEKAKELSGEKSSASNRIGVSQQILTDPNIDFTAG